MRTKSPKTRIGLIHSMLAVQRDLIVGGQAVMEGVMMRTPGAYAIACRRKNGSIVKTAEKLPKWSDTRKWLDLPVLRGGATLIQSMALGVKALNFSARVFEEDLELAKRAKGEAVEAAAVPVEGTMDEGFLKAPVKVIMPEGGKSGPTGQSLSAVGSIVFALLFNIALFIVAPLLLSNMLFIWLGWAPAPTVPGDAGWLGTAKAYVWTVELASFRLWVAFNFIDGLIRMAFFVLMIFSMSFVRDIRRVFEYHGAEHKTVFAWERGLELTPANAAVQSRQHPRCGTSFLMVVMLIAIVLFSVVNFEEMWLNLSVRIALMPLVAGLSYEVIRYAAKKESGAVFKLMTLPGIWLQNITTQEPDEKQLEVAIEALNASLALEPEGA